MLKMRSCSSANRLCAIFTWIYRLLCFRNFKLWFCRLPLLCVCLFLLYWNIPRLTSPEDMDTIYQRSALEAEQSWVETISGEEETVSACSLRHTVKKDNSLRKRFNFLVPLMQWRDSFTPTVWQKLQNASLPYGWKGEADKVIGKTLSLLWHSSTSRLFERNTSHECVRCAVVGNGGILRGSGQGKVIDSHDYVFRVNGAIIKGFEDDVGTKTSFYGFTTNSLKNSLLAYRRDGFKTIPNDPGIRYIVIPAQTRDYVMLAAALQGVPVPSGIDEGDRPSRYFGFNPRIHQFRMIHPHFIQYVTNRFLNSPQMVIYRGFYMPSTGALMLLTALHTCDQVSAYGFMTDNYEDFSDHYYDSEYTPVVHYANHDLKMEGWLWKLLHTHKVMWLYQRQKKTDFTHRQKSAQV
ncbi:alpha-N-acetylgalactosaminide alpha-2,6-sialyltransferase 2 [Triplophysa dalaica]|uniref:alpha-N-acetylgalactosaminide alpha-2,6-sialyltransferase 2 n=1 Tax=Triplophysa dalaica TaxID=1582913 RepID=UPI0024DF8E20|nr:alpha-N-acetylgalactosaminide alpha-2,6-sialyltransferase 2 [Triplophysa dalaica]